MLTICLIGGGILLLLSFAAYLAGAKNPIRCGLANAGLGIGSLLALNLTGLVTGVSLPLSLLHLGMAFCGGPAGVALAVALGLFL